MVHVNTISKIWLRDEFLLELVNTHACSLVGNPSSLTGILQYCVSGESMPALLDQRLLGAPLYFSQDGAYLNLRQRLKEVSRDVECVV